VRKRVVSENMFHDGLSAPRLTTEYPVYIPAGRKLPPRGSLRSHHSQQSLALSDAAVRGRSLIRPMQYCTPPFAFVLRVLRGPHAQSVISRRATHRIRGQSSHVGGTIPLRGDCQAFFGWGSSSSRLLGQQSPYCLRTSSSDRHLTVACLCWAHQK